jgi:hypothetical protein
MLVEKQNTRELELLKFIQTFQRVAWMISGWKENHSLYLHN